MALKPAIHGRDHCPGGADPIPCLEAASSVRPYIMRIMSDATPLTVVAGSAGNEIEFDIDDNDEGSTYFEVITSVQTRIKAQGSGSAGWYHLTAGAKWNPEFDARAALLVTNTAFGWAPSSTYFEPYSGGSPQRGDMVMTLDFTWRQYTTLNTTVELHAIHSHASNQDITQGFLEISYLGAATGNAEGTFEFLS